MKKIFIYFMILLIATTGCSVQRFLPPGEKLYRGATINVEKHPELKERSRPLKAKLRMAVRPRVNKFLLGQPYKVWFYYVLGKQGNAKGFRAWLANRWGEPPVLSSRVNARATAENMQAYMENLGYFHTTVSGDTAHKGYFIKAIYNASVQPQYKLRNITWLKDSSALMDLLEAEQQSNGKLKTGNGYRLSDIDTERDRLDLYVKQKGYYYFTPNYLMAYADSTVGNRSVDLIFNIKTITPDIAKLPYTINRIMIFPNYSLVFPPPDTSKTANINFDGLQIRDTVNRFKPKLFQNTITYRPGRLYNSADQNTTLNRFINLGTFKFVKNRHERTTDSGDAQRLNVFYYLTPTKGKAIQAELDGFSKENKYTGAKISLNWRNRNAFKGAEQLIVKAYAGYETSLAKELRKNNNIRLGAEASIVVPRFFIPFYRIKESYLYLPKTRMLLGYELLRKQLFYTRNIFRFQYEFNWKKNNTQEHSFSPLSLSYLLATNITDSFNREVAINPSLALNVYSEAIIGSFYTYTFNTLNPLKRNQWYFSGGIDLSGNIAGLLSGAKRWREKKIFNTPFAQYVKLDVDFRYRRKLTPNLTFANRLQLGIGIPYNNSELLPFAKQYVIGGASSIRGFPSRTLGPGSYKPTIEDQRFFQVLGGDYKLLLNSEMRFPLAGKLGGAVFIDAGNIWTKSKVLFGEAAQLKKDFLKEVAVATGIGVRYDAQVIVVRFDLGIPLRKPFLPEGERWVLDKINFGSKEWRRENLILNIAIGYPF